MTLENLKRIVDFFYENANRYGRSDAEVIQVGVILNGGKMMPLNNAVIDPSLDKYKLIFTPESPVVSLQDIKPPKPEKIEKPKLTQEEVSEIAKLSKALRELEISSALLKVENKRLKKQLKKDGREDGETKEVQET